MELKFGEEGWKSARWEVYDRVRHSPFLLAAPGIQRSPRDLDDYIFTVRRVRQMDHLFPWWDPSFCFSFVALSKTETPYLRRRARVDGPGAYLAGFEGIGEGRGLLLVALLWEARGAAGERSRVRHDAQSQVRECGCLTGCTLRFCSFLLPRS